MKAGNYNFSTRFVALPFVYDGYAFVIHVQFAKGKVNVHSDVTVTGRMCLTGVLLQDFSGTEIVSMIA